MQAIGLIKFALNITVDDKMPKSQGFGQGG